MNGVEAYGTHAYGADLARARTGVGPQSARKPCETVSDHPGSVPDDEREFLAAGFGVELKRLRKAAALSQGRLGELAGLRGDHVGRLERGTRRPSIAALQALCRILVPEADRQATERRLAALAGDSLREGAARKKQAQDNKHRRAALASAMKAQRTLASTIRAKEARGEIVAGDLRRMAEKLGDTVTRLRAEKVPSLPGNKDAAPSRRQQLLTKTRRVSKKDIRAWVKSALSEPFEDDEDEDL